MLVIFALKASHERRKKPQLPHLLISNTAVTEGYTRPPGSSINPPALPEKDREAHATKLILQLNALRPIEDKIIQQQQEFNTQVRGLQVVFESDPNFTLKLNTVRHSFCLMKI